MFKNYLKMTMAVMRRRKFFTFISLFGITITLFILTVATAFYEHLFRENILNHHASVACMQQYWRSRIPNNKA
ncbi:MAG: hypothetical protein IPL65_14495 [Lewinellaceae bacterium]|nr:hypothetical protein [Lewinellaceae bacterium]